MIRRAKLSDIPALVEMGREFHAMSPHNPIGDYDAEAVARMLRFLIENPGSLVLTNGEGAIGGVLMPVYFNPAKIMVEESFWWARRGGRGLLKAFCDEARQLGASCMLLSTLENDKGRVIDRIVTRAGFRPVERRYLKELT